MINKEYALGLVFGILAAFIIFFIVWKFNKKTAKGSFDERQELVRGRGYKYATFTILGMVVLDLLIESLGAFETIALTRELALFIIILTGVMVYALYCIRNDSYFGVGTDIRSYRAVMWVVIVCNAMSGVSGLRKGALIDGKLQFGPWASILLCIAFAAILISLSVKSRAQAKEDAEEDEM